MFINSLTISLFYTIYHNHIYVKLFLPDPHGALQVGPLPFMSSFSYISH